jgi:hypothetical protein
LLLFPLFAQADEAKTAPTEFAYEDYAGPDFEGRAEAFKLAEEGSWALARDAFAKALPTLTEPKQARWCNYLLSDSSWRAEEAPSDWQVKTAWFEAYRKMLNEQLKGYEQDPRTRDELWVALQMSLMALTDQVHPWEQAQALRLAEWLPILGHLANREPTTENALILLSYLRKALQMHVSAQVFEREKELFLPSGKMATTELHARYLDLLTQLSRSPHLSAADRAWCILRRELLSSRNHRSVADDKKRWHELVPNTRGTPWEQIAEAYLFLADQETASKEPKTNAEERDIPALVAEIDRHLSRVQGQTQEEHSLREQLSSLRTHWTFPRFVLSANENLKPGDDACVSYGQSGLERFHWRLLSVSPEAFLQAFHVWSANFERLLEKQTLLAEGEVELPPAASLRWSSGRFTAARSLKPGLYLFVAETRKQGKPDQDFQGFIVSDLDASMMLPQGRSPAFWLSHHSDRSPWDCKDVRVIYSQQQSLPAEARQGLRCDDQGRCEFTQSFPLTDRGKTEIILVADGHPAVINTWIYPHNTQQLIHGELFVERPLVRPGESCGFKLILRERNGGAWELTKAALQVKVKLNERELLSANPLVLDKLGTWSQRLEIPADAAPGPIILSVAEAGVASNARPLYDSAITQVDRFIPPPFTAKLTISSPPESLRPGGEAVIQVRATYLSGGGVSDAEVKLDRGFNVRHIPGSHKELRSVESWRALLKEHPLSAITDRQGCAEFHVPIPADLEVMGDLTLEFQVLAPGIAPFSGFESLELTPTGMKVTWDANEPTWARPGTHAELAVSLEDGRGEPLARSLEAKLLELHWIERWQAPDGTQQESDTPPSDATKQGWKRLSAGYHERLLRSERVESDATGKVHLAFSIPHEGVYAWQFAKEGKAIEPSWHGLHQKLPGPLVIVADEKTQKLPLDPDCHYLLHNQEARPGETLPVLVVLPPGTQESFLNISDELTTRSLRLLPTGRVLIAQIPVPSSRNSSFRLSLAARDRTNDHRYPSWKKIEKVPDQGRLVLHVQAPATTIRPGSSTPLQLTSTLADGRTAPANISLTVMDDALNELVRSGRDDVQSIFETLQNHIQVISAFNQVKPVQALPEHSPDPRTGEGLDDETIVLNAFSLNASASAASYYSASNTLAGARVALSDSANPISSGVLTNSFSLADLDSPVARKAGNPAPSLQIRRHFSSSALWAPELHTDAQGRLSVSAPLPDNLTRWRAKAYAIADDGQRFALASTTFEAELPFQARLQHPRFLVDGDTVTVLGTLVNRTQASVSASGSLTSSGPLGLLTPKPAPSLTVPASGEARGIWTLHATGTGSAKLLLEAHAGPESDGMEESLPVIEDGLQLALAATGRLPRGEASTEFTLELPTPLDPARTQATLRLTPSLAGALVDALPYLIDYPYGCVEQTMSRFLPAVVVKSVLQKQGFDSAKLEQRVLASTPGRSQAAGFNSLDEVVSRSLERLEGAATPQGGFGWWPESPYANDWMSAYVKWGLENAREAGVEVPDDLSTQLTDFLLSELGQTNNHANDTQAWMLAALSRGALTTAMTGKVQAALNQVFEQRQSLSAWGKACLGLATARLGTEEQRTIVLRNLENGVLRASADGYGETAQWGKGSGYWLAQEGALESTAMNLLALLELKPSHPLVAPAATWLALNRRSDRWGNTRGTAFAVLALSRYLEASGEASSPVELELQINGGTPRRMQLSKESLFDGSTTLSLPLSELRAGSNQFRLRRLSGDGPAYASVSASAWACGDAVKPAASLLALSRSYSEQRPVPSVAGPARSDTIPVGSASLVRLGSGLTAEIRLKVPHDTEYLMLEIPKPAGCEPLNPLSGWDAELVPANLADTDAATPRPFGATRILYREEHDDRSVVFIDSISAGDWVIRLKLQAIFAGDFRVLPVKAEAMYVPEIRANTESRRLRISAE